MSDGVDGILFDSPATASEPVADYLDLELTLTEPLEQLIEAAAEIVNRAERRSVTRCPYCRERLHKNTEGHLYLPHNRDCPVPPLAAALARFEPTPLKQAQAKRRLRNTPDLSGD
jgi:hypothetical protein